MPENAEERGEGTRLRQFKAKLESILNPEDLARILFHDRKLTRSEIDAKIFDLAYQVALRKLAAEACAGDVKALDLFLKRADQYHASIKAPAEREAGVAQSDGFVLPPRQSDEH